MSYRPIPGTVAFRALAHLETLPKGAELMTSALAEAIGCDGRNIVPSLETALAAKLVFRRQRDTHVRSPMWWSLVEHKRQPQDIRMPAVPVLDTEAAQAGPARNGSQKPDGGAASFPGARAGRETPQEGANRAATRFEGNGSKGPDATDREARSKVMAPEGPESPTGRGTNGAPALGAAPAFLRAEPEGAAAIAGGPATAEETTHRGAVRAHAPSCAARAGDDAKPAVGAAAPDGQTTRFAMWSNGVLQIERKTVAGAAELVLLSREETRALVSYLDAISLDSVREAA